MKFIPKKTHNPDLPIEAQEHIENQRKSDIIAVTSFLAFTATTIVASAWIQKKILDTIIPVTETEE